MIPLVLALWSLPYNTLVVAAGVAAVGFGAGVVGCFAVLRRRSLAGDAAAHATLVGVGAAFLASGGRRELSVLLAVEARINRPGEERTAAQRRVALARSAAIAAGPRTPIGPVRDLTVRGADGVLRALHGPGRFEALD
jgi:hypothetical protein